jgi:capsular polysaccharide biosynthesis protein
VRHGWPVAALAVLGAASALALSLLQPTVYRARTRLAVEPARGSDWGQTQAIRETMKSYSADLATLGMAERVGDRLQLDERAADVLERVSVAPDEAVYEIYVDVRDPDEEKAGAISRAWAEEFVTTQNVANQELDQADRILTRLRDRTRTEVWSPKPVTNALAGAVLGALVGLAAVVGLRLLGGGLVQTTGQAGRAARAPLLGAFPVAEAGAP